MDEENKTQTEEKKPEDAKLSAKERDKQERTSLIDRANTAAERLEKATKEQERVLGEQKEFEAKKRLGGVTEAGLPEVKPKVDTDEEYADKVIKGEVNLFG